MDFLQELLEELESEERNIVQCVIDGDRKCYCALSDALKRVFDNIIDMNTVTNCKRCGAPIPRDDMIATRNSGGYCSECRYKMSTLDNED